MPKSKRWAASEHSRIVSGVFPKSIRGGDDEREGKIVQNATFGLSRVRLQSMRNLTAAASARTLLRPGRIRRRGQSQQQLGIRDGSVADRPDDERIADLVPVRVNRLVYWYKCTRSWLRSNVKREFLWSLLGFLDSLVVLVTVPLRIGFFFDPWNELYGRSAWTFALTLFSLLDALFSVLRIVGSRKALKVLLRHSLFLVCVQVLERTARKSSTFRALQASILGDDLSLRSVRSGFSARGDRIAPFDAIPMHRSTKAPKRTLQTTWFETLCKVAYVVPWEAACAPLNYNWMHLAGAMRLPHAVYHLPKQFRVVFFTHLRESKLVQLLSFSTVATVVYLVALGMYLCHVAAAGYMFVAHWRCGLEFTQCAKLPLPQAWVLRDNLERGSKLRKYVRTLYWACKTVTTLGQGDLVPATNDETLYRVIVQFLSGLWATAILTAYSFYFSHKDANMTTNICTRRQQAAQFLKSRKLSDELAANVRTYFQYMDRTRNGVEEDLILSNLPPHYRTQCSHYVKYKCFRHITIFKNRQGAFLRTVLSLLEKDFFAPEQVVLQPHEPEEMFIIAAGEIRITDDSGAIKGRLMPGNAYAEYALFDDHVSMNRLTAETYCELWYLPKRAFKIALRKHFSKLMYASILAKKIGLTKQTAPLTKDAELAARSNSFDDMRQSARMIKLVGHGSTMKNKMVEKLTREATSAAQKISAWRQLNSTFQFVWFRLECALLLLLIAEVPHQIAFQRGFGLLNGENHRAFGAVPFVVQLGDFALALAVEVFFYVDLYFRARCFVRPALTRREQKEEDEHSNVHAVAMITDKTQIFRHYLENESYWLDALAHAPLALVWDVLPKEWFTPRATQFLRFLRALRLVRARRLKAMLKTLMLEHGFAQYSRLLVYIVVCVVSAAHIAGCVFFLVADIDVFHGGLPVEGVKPGGISTPQCLEDASRFGNCTWYMYDRSTFNIDAPYLRSLHWSLVLLSTVGYGDILSFTTKECITGCIWIFFGANICYFTGSALSSVVAQVNILDSIRHERVEEINLTLSCMPATVHESTKSALRSYYETKWKLNGSAVHDEDVMCHLPRSLRRHVLIALFFDDIAKCPLFMGDSAEHRSLLQQLAQAARCEIFLRNSFVIREGHIATEFFLIQSGDAEKLLPALRTTAVDLSKPRPLRESHSRIMDLYSRQSLRLSLKMIAPVSVDSAIAKFTTPFSLPKPSNPGVFLKSRSSPSVIRIRQRSQGPAADQTQTRVGESAERNTTSPTLPQVEGAALDSPVVVSPRRGSIDSRQSLWRIGVKSAPPAPGDETIFISVLKKGDYFGEESLAPKACSEVYQISVRVFSTIQVLVIRRDDFLALHARFPQQFQNILSRRKKQARDNDVLLKKLRVNFFFKEKLRKWLGATDSLSRSARQVVANKAQQAHHHHSLKMRIAGRVFDPEKPFATWWHRVIGAVLAYNFYVVIFRIAFLPYPTDTAMRWLTAVDYATDVLLYADIYLKHQHLGYIEYGLKVLDPAAIRKRYRKTWFVYDCWSMLPLYVQGDYFYMSAARVVRLLRSPQLVTLLDDVHTQIQQHFLKGNTVLSNVFDLVKFVLIFVSTAHYIGSLYYLLGRLQLETKLVTKSWINSDFILAQYPDDPLVHYMRAMYWCLSTFTVDCFGDIWARNFLESCFAGFTCVLGWIFIGQVIGRINTLMITLNQAAKERHERIEDFEQYAKLRALPLALRQRAMQSLAYKSECLLELRVSDVFRDLPTALRSQLFFEMYGPFIKSAQLFQKLTKPQLEAITNVLCIEIYLHGDVIYEAGRTGTKLYIMKTGVGEIFSPVTGVVFAALEPGAMFGEFAFFLRNATRLASARAVRSCQVLQLDKAKWNALWPRALRLEIEDALLPVVKANYLQTAQMYGSVDKNLYTKNDKAAPPLTALRVPVTMSKRFSKVHPAPQAADDTGAAPPAAVPRALTPRRRSSRKMLQDVHPSQRRSFSIEAKVFKTLPSPTTALRRRTMLGRSSSRLGQIMSELGGHQILLNGEEADIPTKPPAGAPAPAKVPTPPALEAPLPIDSQTVATGASLETVTFKPRLPHMLSRRMSSFPPTRRFSSTSAVIEAAGSSRDSATERSRKSSIDAHDGRLVTLPPADAVVSIVNSVQEQKNGEQRLEQQQQPLATDNQEQDDVLYVLKHNDGFLHKLQLESALPDNGPAQEPCVVAAAAEPEPRPLDDAPCPVVSIDDMRLSLSSEAKWKRHYKRLKGIKTYLAGAVKVRALVSNAPVGRRHSISVLPSFEDDLAARDDVQQARRGWHMYFPVRRHSIQGDAAEMAAALLAMDDFEDRMTVEVLLVSPTPPPIEIARATPVSASQRRISTFSSSNSRRLSSPVNRAKTPSPTADDVRAARALTDAAASATRSWWRALLCCCKRKSPARAPSGRAAPAAPPEYVPSVRPKPDSRYQIWVTSAPASPMFLQHSSFRHGWDIVMLAVTLYYLFVLPFRIGFLHEYLTDPAHVVTVEVWFLLEYVFADSLCAVDFVLKRSYFAYLDHGEVVSEPAALAAHYWSHGSFVVDALSILPLELLAVVGVYVMTPPTPAGAAVVSHHPPQTLWHALSLFRINRFLRGVHLHALSDSVQRFVLYDLKVAFARPSLFYLLRLGLDFALGTHWVACLFYGTSYLTFDPVRPSWLTEPGMLLFEGCSSLYDVTHVPVLVAYLRSIHFSIGAITTVCYGDILPLNAIENAVTIGVICLSVAFFSMLSGGFFKFMEHELGKRAQYEERVAQVGHFMVFHQFPARTWKQMQVYFALSWQESKGMHEDEMLRGLTTAVRHEIALYVHANLIKHVKLFTHTDEAFARVVVAALKHELFVRNDVIIQRGDMGRSLYIIETGLVSICVVRSLYARASAVESTAETHGDAHRSSVTEWMAQTTMSLADAQRAAAAGATFTGDSRFGAPHGQATPTMHDLAAALKARGRPVTQREEKFVKGPFDYFGERSLLFGTPRNATCIALCVCSLFVLTIDRFEAIMDEFPAYRSKCVKIWVMNRQLAPASAPGPHAANK